jgi:hypothetical protein
MTSEYFSRREVERSFRKFRDIVNDLVSAKFQTWDDMFSHMITHCDTDPVMRVVIAPLLANKNVNADKWYADCMASVGSMVGTAHYELPYDDEDRTALLYQFFRKIKTERIEIGDFCINAYGATKYQEMVDVFNRELVVKFAREVTYRLDEIMEDIGDQREVSKEAITVFHYHDHSVTVHGNIQGGYVTGSGATISGASASYGTDGELSVVLNEMRSLVSEVAANQKEAVEQAIDLMLRSINDQSVSSSEIAAAASIIVKASPTLGQRLKDITGRIGVSLTGSAIFQGLKMFFGIP